MSAPQFSARDLATITDDGSEKNAEGEWRHVERAVALVTVAKVGARVRCEVLPRDTHGREFRAVGNRWVGYGGTSGYLRERLPGDEAALALTALRAKRKEAEYQHAGLERDAKGAREMAARRMAEAEAFDARAATCAAEVDRLDEEIARMDKDAGDG